MESSNQNHKTPFVRKLLLLATALLLVPLLLSQHVASAQTDTVLEDDEIESDHPFDEYNGNPYFGGPNDLHGGHDHIRDPLPGYDPELQTCGGVSITHHMEPGVPFIGTDALDVVLGTEGSDVIATKGGPDLICSLSGDDEIYSAGHEVGTPGYLGIFAGPGNDVIVAVGDGRFGGYTFIDGGEGEDTITVGADRFEGSVGGGAGRDVITLVRGSAGIFGDAGDDVIETAANSTVIVWAGDGDDSVKVNGAVGLQIAHGNGGNDEIIGGSGSHHFTGDQGKDRLVGGPQADRLAGGQDADIVVGLGGADHLTGGRGDDSLFGGDGDDLLDGESGIDFGGMNICSGNSGVDALVHCG